MSKFEPCNDPSIANQDELYRRVPPWQIENDRPTSPAFHDPELSVFAAKLTNPQKAMAPVSDRSDFSNWKLAGFLAGVPRGLGLLVYMAPSRENPAHALVWGNKTMRIRRRLAEACHWIEWQ